MSTTEIIIAAFVLAGIVGQYWLVSGARRRIERQIREAERQAAAQKANLIEAAFDKQNGDRN